MTRDNLEAALAAVACQVVPDGRLVQYAPLSGGVSAQVYELAIAAPAGDVTRVVLRRPGGARPKANEEGATVREFRLLEALARAGLPVPEPLMLDATGELFPSPFYVMRYIEGSMDVDEARLEAAIDQMADHLACLHRLDPETLDLPALARREDPVEGALQFVPKTAEWVPVRRVLSAYTVGLHAESLLHGDYWPGNMLWRDGELAALIDWDDAAIGPAVSDLACSRCEINAMYGQKAMQRFTAVYLAALGRDVADLALWDVYVGSAALTVMHEWGLPAESEATRRERTTAFVTRAVHELMVADTPSRSRKQST